MMFFHTLHRAGRLPHALDLAAFVSALLPTVLSLLFTMRAIFLHRIYPTPTAIFGALEPITAVVLSIINFGES